MKRSNKKGFTIVELVIVIAIIAILAAVLIPTFASLIQKANTSADIQACREMNTFLAVNEVTGGKDITAVYAVLKEGGMSAKDYHPLVSDRYFFWDSKLNRVLYTDADYNVIFPEDYKSETKANGWLSLSGEIKEQEVKIENNLATVSSAEELYYLSKHHPEANFSIKLTADKLDLMGADISFTYKSNGTYTFEGAESTGTTITGLAQLTNGAEGREECAGRLYASGLIQEVSGNVNLTVKNITIDGATIGDYGTGSTGAVVGRLTPNANKEAATLILDSVTVKNTLVIGKNKVGGLVGFSHNATITVKNCSLEKVTVNCVEGESGKVFGAVTNINLNNDSQTLDSICKDGVTLNLIESEGRKAYEGETTWNGKKIEATAVKMNDAGNYRLFFKDAYLTVILDGGEDTITIAGKTITVKTSKVEAGTEFTAKDGTKVTLKENFTVNPTLIAD